jgi:polysaccharide biosynthesis transport protein
MDSVPPLKETVDLRSYVQVLWKRRWVVLVPTVLAAITGFIVTLPAIMRPVYQSSSTLMVELPQQLSQQLASMVQNRSVEEQMARLSGQIQSTEFLTKIIDNTGLRSDAGIQEWARKNQKRYPELTLADLVDLKLIDYLRQIIRISPGTAGGRSRIAMGNVIQVSAQDYYPDRARRLVQNLTAGIIEANRSEQLKGVKSTGDFSATQLQEYQSKLKAAEDRLERYRREVMERKAQPTLVTEQSVPLVRELRETAASDLELQIRLQEAAAGNLRSAGIDPNVLESLLALPDAARLLEQARGMERDFVRQSIIGAGSNAQAGQSASLALARKVDEIGAALQANLAGKAIPASSGADAESYLLAAVRRELARIRRDAYDSQIAQYTTALTGLPQADLEFQRLQQDVDTYRALQSTFLQQLASSQISEAFGSSNLGEKISILEPAEHPLAPVRPKRAQIILLAILAGLAIGTVGAFFLEHHDPSLRDVRDLEGLFGLRVLGTVPNLHTLARLADPSREGGDPVLRAAAVERAARNFLNDSPGYQEFRKLVLDLLRPASGGPRTIMVTSARRGEGKSTSSVCLALALAKELPTERVVLVDLDVRNPTLGPFFGVNGHSGGVGARLSELVLTDDMLHELPFSLPNLRLIVIEKLLPREGDLVTREGVRALLRELAGRADRIVIDAPPNLPVPDALIIGHEADGVLMVVRAGSTPRETVRRGLELQRQFRDNILGVLLNNSAEVLPYYYEHKHYGQRYGKPRPDA